MIVFRFDNTRGRYRAWRWHKLPIDHVELKSASPQAIARILRLAERIPERRRTVLILRIEGKEFSEIGRLLGVHKGTAYHDCGRALREISCMARQEERRTTEAEIGGLVYAPPSRTQEVNQCDKPG